MANTIRASKSTFYGGLVMDLSPDTTPNEVLTSALNATLVTFNGNEMQLQNDMGNGRVETARLPEGYIPVGTCEFGDIIYIVSYNPLTNKSQIGCFPSPERNISSEEIGNAGQTLSASDFQVLNNDIPTGELKTSSVKKILYQNKLNPGDKFVIYDTNNQILNETHITDIGNTSHTYGSFPKWLRIHVIAIEDSGKITYLDSSMKWYESGNLTPTDYFIRTSIDKTNKPDIDSYRNLLSSGYSVYQSKISGKLALLIELEKIEGFSCTYTIYSKNTIINTITNSKNTIVNTITDNKNNTDNKNYGDIYYKQYYIYWNFNWDTNDPNINPAWIVLTKSEWTGREEGKGGTYYKWALDNNKYYLDIEQANKQINEQTNKQPDDIIKDQIPLVNKWSVDITSNISTSDYNTFINGGDVTIGSYQVVLNKFLKDREELYGNMPLTKLNICRINDGNYKQLPKIGQYYINATKLEYKKQDEQLIEQAYTQKYYDGRYTEIESIAITDDIVNNYFHYPIYKAFTEFTIPIKQIFKEVVNNTSNKTDEKNSNKTSKENSNITSNKETIIREFKPDIRNLIYHYEITPAMPYGLLREYSIDGYIDFSKIGTGEINLKSWKYFNGENISTLTIGMDAYVEDNMGIQSVVLEFYDNQGMAAAYHITGKSSYSGQFTEMIPLNGSTNTYKLQNIDAEGNKHLHLGPKAHKGDLNLVRFDTVNNKIIETNWINDGLCYIDDCGTIYSNMLYLVKIIVKYCPINALGEFDTSDSTNYKHFYRWMWTNTMFNQYYHNITDFNDIQLELTLDVFPKYELTNSYYYGQFEYNSPNEKALTDTQDIYKYLSAKVQVVSDTNSAKNVIGNIIGNGTEVGGGEVGGDNPSEPEPELTQEISNGIKTFTITFNKAITNINFEKIIFKCGVVTYVKDSDYTVAQGIGSYQFTVTFPNVGNTYYMYINVPEGAITLGKDKNSEIKYTYSYKDGLLQ